MQRKREAKEHGDKIKNMNKKNTENLNAMLKTYVRANEKISHHTRREKHWARYMYVYIRYVQSTTSASFALEENTPGNSNNNNNNNNNDATNMHGCTGHLRRPLEK